MIEKIIATIELEKDAFFSLSRLEPEEMQFALDQQFKMEKNNVNDAFSLSDWRYNARQLKVDYSLKADETGYRAIAEYVRLSTDETKT